MDLLTTSCQQTPSTEKLQEKLVSGFSVKISLQMYTSVYVTLLDLASVEAVSGLPGV